MYKQNYNLFIIESPMQLMCAIDAKKDLKLDHDFNILIYIKSKCIRNENTRQIESMLINEEWTIIQPLILGGNRIIDSIKIIKLVNYIRNIHLIKSVFIGEFRNTVFHILAAMSKPRELILLDDGNITIHLQLHYFRFGKGYTEYLSEKGRWSVYFIKLLAAIGYTLNRVPNLYTLFNLKDFTAPNQILYQNTRGRRTENSLTPNATEINFFGSKLSDWNLMTLNKELELLNEVYKWLALRYTNKQINYIPHRDERKEKLQRCEEIGFTVKRLGTPAELYFSKHRNAEVISGFGSTVLYTLYANNTKIKQSISFSIKNYISNDDIKTEMRSVELFYKETGIEIIEIC